MSWLQYLALPELLYDQMPKTLPTWRSSRAKASERPPDDQTISAPRRARKASKAAPLPAHHQDTNTPGPSAVGAEPAWMDQLLDKLDSRIQTAVNEALNARQAAVSSPTVPAAPHLEDVEQAVQVSMLASVSDSMTSTGPSCSFISSSISNQVPLKIKQKMGGGRGGGTICRHTGYVVRVGGGSVSHTDRPDRRGTITTASVSEEVCSSHTTRLDKGIE